MPICFKVSNVSLSRPKFTALKVNDLDVYKKAIGGRVLQSSNLQNVNREPNNGFVNTAAECYNKHHRLVLRPDDVWIGILTQFSRYVEANSEALRSKFVGFEGKKHLIVYQESTLDTADYSLLAKDMIDEISKNITDEKIKEWLVPAFSTTTETDTIVGSIIMMSSMQKYFTYEFGLLCGLPEVELLGTPEDWNEIKRRAGMLVNYDTKDGYMKKWYSMLEPVLDNFIKSINGNPDVKWWNQICSYVGGESGPTYISGWLSVFTVFDRDGRFMGDMFEFDDDGNNRKSQWPFIDTDEICCGYVTVPVKINDMVSGIEHESFMVAGHIGNLINKYSLSPNIGWFIALKDDSAIQAASRLLQL